MALRLAAAPGVVEKTHLAGEVGVLALHGRLERRTEWVAETVASRAGASLHTVTVPPDLWWHVPSTRFGEAPTPGLAAFLDHVRVVVSIHGYGRTGMERVVLLGGRNRCLAADLAGRIRATGVLEAIDDLDEIPRGLRGMASRNPVNVPRDAGVQVEVPGGARGGPGFAALVGAIADTIA